MVLELTCHDRRVNTLVPGCVQIELNCDLPASPAGERLTT